MCGPMPQWNNWATLPQATITADIGTSELHFYRSIEDSMFVTLLNKRHFSWLIMASFNCPMNFITKNVSPLCIIPRVVSNPFATYYLWWPWQFNVQLRVGVLVDQTLAKPKTTWHSQFLYWDYHFSVLWQRTSNILDARTWAYISPYIHIYTQ